MVMEGGRVRIEPHRSFKMTAVAAIFVFKIRVNRGLCAKSVNLIKFLAMYRTFLDSTRKNGCLERVSRF